MEYQIIHCPKCNGELHVPAELSSCICMYCGEKLSLTCQEKEVALEEAPETIHNNYKLALENITLLVKDYDRIITNFNRNHYQTSFENYNKTVEGLLSVMEQYADLSGVDFDQVISEITKKLIEAIEADINRARGMLSGSLKTKTIDQYRFFITVYLIPLIRSKRFNISEPLSDCIITLWSKRYPKYEFKKASYEEIQNGFERKGFCFITSAVCDSKNKSDDCYELTKFRAFRDSYMQQTPERRRLISQYYEVAPTIVAYIDFCTDRKESYDRIWEKYLCHCLRAIEANTYELCEKHYIRMVEDLKEIVPVEFM